MARLEVRWSGEEQAGVAVALEGLGLHEVGRGFFVAEGEGRSLVRVLGAIRELEKRVRGAAHRGELKVVFQDDPRGAAV